MNLPDLMTPAQLADATGIPVGTWANWRVTGKGPTFIKINQCVRYPRADFMAWLASKKRQNTTTASECPRDEVQL